MADICDARTTVAVATRGWNQSLPIFPPAPGSASALPTHGGNWSNSGDYVDSQKLSCNVGSGDLFVSFERGL